MKKNICSVIICFLFINCYSQNVGIGTTNPLTKLHVSGTAGSIAIFSGGDQMYITLAEGLNNRGYIGSFAGNAEDVDFGTYSGNPGKVHLTTNSTPRLSVLSNGNVGIGTVNPEQLFSVQSGMVVDQGNSNIGTVANTIRFGSLSGEAIGSKRSGLNNFGLDFYTQGFQRMTISNGGNVGIGLATPGSRLELRGALGFSSTTKKWEMNYDSTAGYFYIDEFGSARRLFIKNGGNVGIGNANPQATLDINGDINIQNKIMLNNATGNAGQVLVSGGPSASASWQSAAYGNNDRFLYTTNNNSVANNTFFDTLKFNTIYALSPAISYSNGLFTINKTGFYRLEGSFNAYAEWSNNQTALAFVEIYIPGGPLVFGNEYMSSIPTGSYYSADKIFPLTTTLYFTAGSSFYFWGTIFGAATPLNAGFGNSWPLSIFLIAE